VRVALNSPEEGLLSVWAKHRRVPESDTGGGAELSRVRLEHGWAEEMTSGPQLSATVARRRRGSGLAVAVGRLGRCDSCVHRGRSGLVATAGCDAKLDWDVERGALGCQAELGRG
jgi:hypothetical protein